VHVQKYFPQFSCQVIHKSGYICHVTVHHAIILPEGVLKFTSSKLDHLLVNLIHIDNIYTGMCIYYVWQCIEKSIELNKKIVSI